MRPDSFAAVALSRVPSIGAKLFRALIAHFGSAEMALRAGPDELKAVGGIADRTAARFGSGAYEKEAERILSFAGRNEVDILVTGGEAYPPMLNGFADAPPVLYHRGGTDFSRPRSAAIVGTRKMSTLGGQQVERLLDLWANHEVLIVSGLAYGVDAAAHRRALHLGLPTLAVLGSGFEHIYPGAHRDLAQRMCERGGGVLTEYPPWYTPEREHFPARNRIVAMLSQITVVVESDRRGGSMITANMAHEYGRRVGACPGRGGDTRTAGCNALIKAGKAHLIEDGGDVINLMGWKGGKASLKQMNLFQKLSEEERQLVDFLNERDSGSIDELHRTLGIPPAKLAGVLLTLEVQGVIASLPGHRYRLVG